MTTTPTTTGFDVRLPKHHAQYLIVEKLYDPEDVADRLDDHELRELFINAVVNKASRRAVRGTSNASRADAGAGLEVGAAERDGEAGSARTSAAAMRESGGGVEEEDFAVDDSTQLLEFDDMTSSELESKALKLLSRAVSAETSGEGGRHSLVAEAVTALVARDDIKSFPPAMAFGERSTPRSVFAAFAIHLSYVHCHLSSFHPCFLPISLGRRA